MIRLKAALAPILAGPVLAVAALIASLTMATGAVAQSAYHIRPGDVLRVEVIEDSSLDRSVLVPPDGRITVPLAGSVAAAGRTVEQVQQALSQQLAPNFAAPPSVFVSIDRLVEPRERASAPAPVPTVNVYLMGEFNAPGGMAVPPGTTVLQLFASGKGFTRFAATRRIQMHRVQKDGTTRIYPLDYDAILSGQSPNGSVVVAPGDVFVAPVRRLFE